jgi:hypothetical protein
MKSSVTKTVRMTAPQDGPVKYVRTVIYYRLHALRTHTVDLLLNYRLKLNTNLVKSKVQNILLE